MKIKGGGRGVEGPYRLVRFELWPVLQQNPSQGVAALLAFDAEPSSLETDSRFLNKI